MSQSKQVTQSENEFLSICSSHDRDLLMGRADMTKKDFERILYLTMALGDMEYAKQLSERYEDFASELSEQSEKESGIAEKSAQDYFDGQADVCQKWVDDFCDQLPEDKQAYYREKLVSGIK
ncbi:MAG: hypothetical protein NC293_05145 [Roseburia sp.]|nr:hypothetical protein [Roseburia sp.]